MKTEFIVKSLEVALKDSAQYEKIKLCAINIYYSTQSSVSGISEKCKIIFNPNNPPLQKTGDFLDIEKYFDVEIIDNFSRMRKKDAALYKKSFVFACQFMYETKQLK